MSIHTVQITLGVLGVLSFFAFLISAIEAPNLKSLRIPVVAFLLAIACAVSAGVLELIDDTPTWDERIEAKYDIEIGSYPVGNKDEPGNWKIDGEWLNCYSPDIYEDDDETLLCQPVTPEVEFVEVGEQRGTSEYQAATMAAIAVEKLFSVNSGYPRTIDDVRHIVGLYAEDATLVSYTGTKNSYEFCLTIGDRSATYDSIESTRVLGPASDCDGSTD